MRALTVAICLLAATPVFAQAGGDPWTRAVQVLQQSFTTTIARGLALVAIVVGGLGFAYGEGGSKRLLAGIIFGSGMAGFPRQFLWLAVSGLNHSRRAPWAHAPTPRPRPRPRVC